MNDQPVKNAENWKSTTFGQLAKNISKRIIPSETDLDRYVGLEHIDPSRIKISRFGHPSDVKGQKLLASKGQIIFGKRRAYQKKVAVFEWDCICSAHAMVLEPILDNVLPEFLPIFMLSRTFTNRAIMISEGSLSPTIKWKTLANQEFLVPTIEEQRRLLPVIKQISNYIADIDETCSTGERTRQCIIDNLGFLNSNNNWEYFENINFENWKTTKLGDLTNHETARNQGDHTDADLMGVDKTQGIVPMRDQVKGKTVDRCKLIKTGYFAYNPMRLNIGSIACWKGQETRIVSPDYVVFSCDLSKLLPEYFDLVRRSNAWRCFVESSGTGSVRTRIYYKDIENFLFRCPPLQTQKEIVALVSSIDKLIESQFRKRSEVSEIIDFIVTRD